MDHNTVVDSKKNITENGIVRAKYKPTNTVVLKIDEIEPLTKILDEDFYNSVITSLEKEGLRYPLVIVEIGEDEWREEAETDGTILLPENNSKPKRLRIQNGNNRYWALKHYWGKEIKAIECIVCSSLEEAIPVIKEIRKDRRWLRPTQT